MVKYTSYIYFLAFIIMLFVPVQMFPDGYAYMARNVDTGYSDFGFLTDNIEFFFDFRSQPVKGDYIDLIYILLISFIFTFSCVLTIYILHQTNLVKNSFYKSLEKYGFLLFAPTSLLGLLGPSLKVLLLPVAVMIIQLSQSFVKSEKITKINIALYFVIIFLAVFIDTGDGIAIFIYSVCYITSAIVIQKIRNFQGQFFLQYLTVCSLFLLSIYIGGKAQIFLEVLKTFMPQGPIYNEITDYIYYNQTLVDKSYPLILGYFLLSLITGSTVKVILLSHLIFIIFIIVSCWKKTEIFEDIFGIFLPLLLLFGLLHEFRFLLTANYFYIPFICSIFVNDRVMQEISARPLVLATLQFVLLVELLISRIIT